MKEVEYIAFNKLFLYLEYFHKFNVYCNMTKNVEVISLFIAI